MTAPDEAVDAPDGSVEAPGAADGTGDEDVEAPGEEPAGPAGWGTAVVQASGVVLAGMLVVHVLQTFVLDDVGSFSAQSFNERWSNPAWRVFDWTLVVLALVHGTVALRPVLDERIVGERLRGALLALLYTVVALLVAFVTLAALTARFV